MGSIQGYWCRLYGVACVRVEQVQQSASEDQEEDGGEP